MKGSFGTAKTTLTENFRNFGLLTVISITMATDVLFYALYKAKLINSSIINH